MSYTLTSLIPVLYSAKDIVSREMVGFIPSVTLDATAERAAVNQTIRSFRTRPASPQNITPGTYVPAGNSKTADPVDLSITKSKSELLPWTGDEQLSVQASFGANAILVDDVAQAMRSLINEMEADIATAAYLGASRAYGTAGTTPFASDLTDSANILQILKDNGAPESERQFVINTTAGTKLRSLAQLTKANEAGTMSLREQGILLDIHGFKFRESAGISLVTKGSGTGFSTTVSAKAVGETVIDMTGTGTIPAGSVITFAGDTNKYVVAVAYSAGTGKLTLAAPGLRQSLATGVNVTLGNAYTPNFGFTRNAIALAVRKPAVPAGGDLAVDSIEIQDERSGITFELRKYLGYHQVTYEVGLAWGAAVIKPEHLSMLLG